MHDYSVQQRQRYYSDMFEDVPLSLKQQRQPGLRQFGLASVFFRVFTRERVEGMLLMLALVLAVRYFYTEPEVQVSSHRRLIQKDRWYEIKEDNLAFGGKVAQIIGEEPVTRSHTKRWKALVRDPSTGEIISESSMIPVSHLNPKGWNGDRKTALVKLNHYFNLLYSRTAVQEHNRYLDKLYELWLPLIPKDNVTVVLRGLTKDNGLRGTLEGQLHKGGASRDKLNYRWNFKSSSGALKAVKPINFELIDPETLLPPVPMLGHTETV